MSAVRVYASRCLSFAWRGVYVKTCVCNLCVYSRRAWETVDTLVARITRCCKYTTNENARALAHTHSHYLNTHARTHINTHVRMRTHSHTHARMHSFTYAQTHTTSRLYDVLRKGIHVNCDVITDNRSLRDLTVVLRSRNFLAQIRLIWEYVIKFKT